MSTSPLKCGDAGAYVSPFQLAFSAAAPLSPVVVAAQPDGAPIEPAALDGAVGPESEARPREATDAPPSPSPQARPGAGVAVEEVFENQRYQMVLGWGSKGHLLPLDPGKYMRAIRRPRRKPRCRRSSLGDYVLPRAHYNAVGAGERLSDPSSDDSDAFGLDASGDVVRETGDDVDTEWLHSPVFPDIALPMCADRARRWEWISPWHLEFPAPSTSPSPAADEPAVDPDGWQYATSFQHFALARSSTAAGGTTELLNQPVVAPPLVSPTWRPKHYVRCRKWVRYRRLFDGSSGDGTASAFDDAFLDSMRGWLRKLGHVRKNWKARYFVLERSVLRYYADASLTRLKGEVLLFHPATCVHYVDIHVAGGRDCAFAVHVGKDYALLLQAAALSDRESWMYCIEDALLCRDSYRQHPNDASAMRVDVRESVALRRKLSSEAMVFNTAATTNLVALVDSQTLLQRAAQRTSVVRQVLVECDAFVASPALQTLASAFVNKFKHKYAASAASGDVSRRRRSRGASCADAQPLLLSPSETRASDSSNSSDAMPTVAALQDARSLLALKSYRFFLERSLATVLSHLTTLPCLTGSPVTSPRGYRPTAPAPTSSSPPRVSDDEWQLVRKAALYKLERLTFIPLQDVLYDLVESTLCPRELAAFERSRAHVRSQSQASLEIRATHASPSHWRSATALLDTIDNYSLPCEKASVLLAVARCIYETHASEHCESAGAAMAADDFLPIFIFVLAHCRLRNVVVTRHLISETMVSALMVGETGYYATMLEAAVGYIASVDADASMAS